MIKLIIGIALVVGTLVSVGYSVSQTPENLRGFYGFFYAIISLAGLVGGVVLAVSYFIS